MDYGCQVYQSAKQNVLQRLDTVHHMAIRMFTGAFKSSLIDSLYAEAGEAPLSVRIQITLQQHYFRVQRLPNTPTYAAVFEPEINGSSQGNEKLSALFHVTAERYLDHCLCAAARDNTRCTSRETSMEA